MLTLGCGRKAPLRAPEDVVPATIADLKAANLREGLQLTWARPRTCADGTRLSDLGGFEIERASAAELRPVFARINTLEVSDRERFRQIARFQYVDADTTAGQTYQYRVVSFTVDRYFSAPSNIVTIERTVPDEEKHASLPAAPR